MWILFIKEHTKHIVLQKKVYHLKNILVICLLQLKNFTLLKKGFTIINIKILWVPNLNNVFSVINLHQLQEWQHI